MTLQDLEQIAASGESVTVEFKKSTAQLPRVGETLCAFLNGQGGQPVSKDPLHPSFVNACDGIGLILSFQKSPPLS
jgi:hypothetical protein